MPPTRSGLTLDEFEGRYQRISHIKTLMRKACSMTSAASTRRSPGVVAIHARCDLIAHADRKQGKASTVPLLKSLDDVRTSGRRSMRLAAEIYPICRSITGDGVRTVP